MAALSVNGSAYIRTAVAPPDFDNLDDQGIPDQYDGKSVTIKEMYSTTISVDPDSTAYYLVTPTPGVSYWNKTLAASQVWATNMQIQSFMSPNAQDLFTNAMTTRQGGMVGGTNTDKVDQGRCTCLAAELVPINNNFNSYGTITAFKTPLAVQFEQKIPGSSDQDQITVTGCSSFVEFGQKSKPNNANAYVQPVREGAYVVSMRTEEDAPFLPIRDEETRHEVHTAWVGPEALAPGNLVNFHGPLLFWDTAFDTIVFQIDVPANVPFSQGFILKIWKAYEYKPTFNSFPYQLAGHSAPYDPRALRLYGEMARALPVAVPYKDNPDFWKSILSTVKLGSGLLRGLPGVGGVIAKGVHAVADYLDKPTVTQNKNKDLSLIRHVETTPSYDGSGKVFLTSRQPRRRARRGRRGDTIITNVVRPRRSRRRRRR